MIIGQYYPFGSLVPNRHGSSNAYRYGFNGKEKDDELKGEGNSYDFGARMLDPRIGRWFARDPMESKYPYLSTYDYVANNPLNAVDPDGKDIIYLNKDGGIRKVVDDGLTTIKIVDFNKVKTSLDKIDVSASLFSWNNRNRQIVANIGKYYGGKIGFKGTIRSKTEIDDSSNASTDPDRTSITISSHPNGHISGEISGNKYNLMSTLEHEKFHTEESGKGDYTYTKHSEVYTKQMKSDIFSKTSEDYQLSKIESFTRYIQGAKNNEEKDYKKMIDKFNKLKIKGGYKIIDRDSGGIQTFDNKGKEMPRLLAAPPETPEG